MKIEFSGSRRTFLKSATIFGGVSLLLGMGGKLPDGQKQDASDRKPEQTGQGYRLTEHVKKYYETARS